MTTKIFCVVQPNLRYCSTYLIYKYVTDDAQQDTIIPTAANVPPIKVTVLYEYFTDNILDRGPARRNRKKEMVGVIRSIGHNVRVRQQIHMIFDVRVSESITDGIAVQDMENSSLFQQTILFIFNLLFSKFIVHAHFHHNL